MKGICTGTMQSLFAMMYNFPARVTIAHRSHQEKQAFSQRDMESTFKAYLAVCYRYCPYEEVYSWFKSLITPWIPGYLQAAATIQAERDRARAQRTDASKLTKAQKRNTTWLDRRTALPHQVGIIKHVTYPILDVSTK
jgi:hypothetical protein